MAELIIDIESIKKYLEKQDGHHEFMVDSMPQGLMDPMVMQGLKILAIHRARILCSFTVPHRLVNGENRLDSGAMATLVDLVGSAVVFTTGAPTSGVSVDINVSYLDAAYLGDEIEIEAKAKRVGKAIAVVAVELRCAKTGKIIAVGRHTKYLLIRSKI